MTGSRYRRASAILLALFFVAVAAAPHHHVNDLEDLLFDQRSDSGTVLQTPKLLFAPGSAGLVPVHFVQDFPCLACFGGDFVSAPAASFVLTAALTPLPLLPTPPASATPELVPADTSSRAPPNIS